MIGELIVIATVVLLPASIFLSMLAALGLAIAGLAIDPSRAAAGPALRRGQLGTTGPAAAMSSVTPSA